MLRRRFCDAASAARLPCQYVATMPARPTTPITMPVTMVGQSETVTTGTAAAIASRMAFHPSCPLPGLGYPYPGSAPWDHTPREGGLHRMVAPMIGCAPSLAVGV